MKFINLTTDYIDFLDNKNFHFNTNKLKLYSKKEGNKKIFSSENTNNDFDKVLYKLCFTQVGGLAFSFTLFK